MAKVTSIIKSAESMNAIVVLDNGDQHAFQLHIDSDKASAQILGDAASGKLATYLDFFESDTDEEIAETKSQGNDWVEIYSA